MISGDEALPLGTDAVQQALKARLGAQGFEQRVAVGRQRVIDNSGIVTAKMMQADNYLPTAKRRTCRMAGFECPADHSRCRMPIEQPAAGFREAREISRRSSDFRNYRAPGEGNRKQPRGRFPGGGERPVPFSHVLSMETCKEDPMKRSGPFSTRDTLMVVFVFVALFAADVSAQQSSLQSLSRR